MIIESLHGGYHFLVEITAVVFRLNQLEMNLNQLQSMVESTAVDLYLFKPLFL